MAGMREVAKLAGVSLSTVSTVLNNTDKYVSPEVVERVHNAIQALDYRLPPKKRATEKTIAVILPVITSVFFSNLLNGVENAAAEKGYSLLFGNSGFRFDKERRYIEMIQKQALSGVIIDTVCPAESEQEYLLQLKTVFVEKGIPVVFLEHEIPDDSFYCIYVDHLHNAYLSTRHLLEMGHHRVAHIAGYPQHQLTLERIKGYRKALAEAGIAFDPELVGEGDFTPNSGYLAMKTLLSRRSDLTAIFSANDQMAIGAIKAIKSEGKQVPQNIAVAGIDNLSISSLISPALTTVNVPTYEMGFLSAKIISNIRDHLPCKKQHKLDCNLIVRKSTNSFASNEWELFGW